MRALFQGWAVLFLATACSGPEASGTGGPGPGGPGPTALDEATFARLVVAMGSCNGDDGPFRITTFLRGKQGGYTYPHVSPSCLTSVKNGCDGIFACYGLAAPPPGAASGTCVGNIAVSDMGGWDCTQVGATCQAGQCVPPGGQTCDTSFEPTCDAAGRPTDCQHQIQVGPACPTLGLSCNATSSSYDAYCEGTGAACSTAGGLDDYFDVAPHGTACTDTGTLSACVRGKMADLDCALLGDGFRCQTSGTASFCGLRGDCDPGTFGVQCEGTTAVFCDAGRVERVDCASFGFTRCLAGTGSICQ